MALLVVLALGLLPVAAQQRGKTVRKTRVAVTETAPAVVQAEAAMEKQDWATAERLLRPYLEKTPGDYRGWFNMGFVLGATNRRAEAAEAYRHSIAAKPDLFESNLNLGMLLASEEDPEAEKYLAAATRLKPQGKAEAQLARAWLALGQVLEGRSKSEAAAAYREAAKLEPKNPEAPLAAGVVLESLGDLEGAEAEYRRAAELDGRSAEAVTGLVNVYMRQKRLPEAEQSLRQLLALDPRNLNARLQLGRVLVAQEKHDAALAEFEAAQQAAPQDHEVALELAALYERAGKMEQAAQTYRSLLAKQPSNADLQYALGRNLLRTRNFAEAEQALQQAIRLKPNLGAAYGDLALAAAENKHYQLAIAALDARARYLPEAPQTYFLRATCYDSLQARKEAAENYKQFLAVAAGKYPDEEWKARHRLNALEPKK